MKKEKIEKKEYRKKIIDVTKDISIWADKEQYIVRVLKGNKKEEGDAYDSWYLPSLTSCYWEIYEHILKENLTEKVCRDVDEIKEVYKKTKDQISKILDIDKN